MEFQIQMSNVGCFLRLSPTHRLTNKDVPRDWLPWPWELGPTWNGVKCHHGLSLSPFHLSTRRYTLWMSQPSLRFKPGIPISYSRLVWIVMRTPLTCTLLLKSRLPVLKLGYTSNELKAKAEVEAAVEKFVSIKKQRKTRWELKVLPTRTANVTKTTKTLLV